MSASFTVVHAGAVHNGGVIQQALVLLLRALEFREKAIEAREVESIDVGELREHARIAAMVGKLVVALTGAAEAVGLRGPLEGDHPRGVCGKGR
nr:hypothetical protein [Verrucomicrobium spinosum]